jgi:hypothetical protein
MPKHRIFSTAFSGFYPYHIRNAERKNRTKEEVDQSFISYIYLSLQVNLYLFK